MIANFWSRIPCSLNKGWLQGWGNDLPVYFSIEEEWERLLRESKSEVRFHIKERQKGKTEVQDFYPDFTYFVNPSEELKPIAKLSCEFQFQFLLIRYHPYIFVKLNSPILNQLKLRIIEPIKEPIGSFFLSLLVFTRAIMEYSAFEPYRLINFSTESCLSKISSPFICYSLGPNLF